MVQDLRCIYKERDLRVFNEIFIVEATQLPLFSHLDKDEDVLSIMNSIPEDFQAMHMALKFDHSLQNPTKLKDNETSNDVSISFPIGPQDKNLRNLLETYQNKLVVALLKKSSSHYFYGSTLHPLTFIYQELHGSNFEDQKGYSITIQGFSPAQPKLFTQVQINENPIISGLAFYLAQDL